MASNRYAALEDTFVGTHDEPPTATNSTTATTFCGEAAETAPYGEYGRYAERPYAAEYGEHGDYAQEYGQFAEYTPAAGPTEPGEPGEWNPSEDTLRPVRGRHRVSRQRGGTIARSRAVLGVGVIAAVGAGGMATANEDGAGAVPGLGDAAEKVKAIPGEIPLIGGLVSGSDSSDAEYEMTAMAPFTTAGMTQADIDAGQTDAGEALRARILQQADQQETTAEEQAVEEALAQAEEQAAEAAAAQAEAERQAEEERLRREEEERRRREEAERLRQLRESYTLPLSDFTLSSYFGETSSYWATTHTGQDFAAPTGTPVKNVHTGVVTEAAWAGSYGYRVIVELEDGTEIYYCHLSSMNVSVGQEVVTEEVIGQVGSTGNSTGPHLHLEVLPGGADAIDPLAWLREMGLSI